MSCRLSEPAGRECAEPRPHSRDCLFDSRRTVQLRQKHAPLRQSKSDAPRVHRVRGESRITERQDARRRLIEHPGRQGVQQSARVKRHSDGFRPAAAEYLGDRGIAQERFVESCAGEIRASAGSRADDRCGEPRPIGGCHDDSLTRVLGSDSADRYDSGACAEPPRHVVQRNVVHESALVQTAPSPGAVEDDLRAHAGSVRERHADMPVLAGCTCLDSYSRDDAHTGFSQVSPEGHLDDDASATEDG